MLGLKSAIRRTIGWYRWKPQLGSIASPHSMGSDGQPLIDYDARAFFGSVRSPGSDQVGRSYTAGAPTADPLVGIGGLSLPGVRFAAPSGDATGATDTANINGLLAAASLVVLMGGTWHVTTLLVPNQSRLWITGGAFVRQVNGTAGYIVTNKTPGTDAYVIVTVDGIVSAVDNVGSNTGGVVLVGASYSRIEGAGFIQFTNGWGAAIVGFGLAASGDAMYCTIQDVEVRDPTSGVGIGAACAAAGSHPDAVTIRRTKVASNVVIHYQIAAPAAGNLGVDTPTIENVTSISNTAAAVTILDIVAQSARIKNGRFEQVGSGGQVVNINAGPGSFPTLNTQFEGNAYANGAGGLTWNDNGTRTGIIYQQSPLSAALGADTLLSATTNLALLTLAIPPGVWHLIGRVYWNCTNPAITELDAWMGTTSANSPGDAGGIAITGNIAGAMEDGVIAIDAIVTITKASGGAQYYLNVKAGVANQINLKKTSFVGSSPATTFQAVCVAGVPGQG